MQTNGVNAALGAKVRALRQVHGWSQAELAQRFGDAIGVSGFNPSQITRMERGQRPFPIHETVVLAQILGIELVDFLKFVAPLDDAVAAGRIHLRMLRDRIEAQTRLATAFAVYLDDLVALQRYREEGDLHDLVAGMSFVLNAEAFERRNWRELLLDAGVAEESITGALEDAEGDASSGTFYRALCEREVARVERERARDARRRRRPAKAATAGAQ